MQTVKVSDYDITALIIGPQWRVTFGVFTKRAEESFAASFRRLFVKTPTQ
jgi:hypothetical protein